MLYLKLVLKFAIFVCLVVGTNRPVKISMSAEKTCKKIKISKQTINLERKCKF